MFTGQILIPEQIILNNSLSNLIDFCGATFSSSKAVEDSHTIWRFLSSFDSLLANQPEQRQASSRVLLAVKQTRKKL